MDVNFSREEKEVDTNNLIQQMAEFQSWSYREYESDLSRFIARVTNAFREYLDARHPWLHFPHDGPHFQVALRFLKDAALLLYEITDLRNIAVDYSKIAVGVSDALLKGFGDWDDGSNYSTQEKIEKVTLELEALGNIRNTLGVMRQIRLDRERDYGKLALHIQKVIELAQKAVAETLPEAVEEADAILLIIRKDILLICDYKLIQPEFEYHDEAWQNFKENEELFLKIVNDRMELAEKIHANFLTLVENEEALVNYLNQESGNDSGNEMQLQPDSESFGDVEEDQELN